MQGRNEIGGQPRLDDIASTARLHSRPHIIGIVMHREKHQLRTATSLPEAVRGLDAVQTWHGDVEDHHVRIQPRRCLNHVQPVTDRADDFKLASQQPGNLFKQGWVVIRQQKSWG